MMHIYSQDAVDRAAQKLFKLGYTFHALPGSLIDPFVAEAPDDHHWNYVFKEVALNEWSSAYTVRKCRKISAAIWKQVSKA